MPGSVTVCSQLGGKGEDMSESAGRRHGRSIVLVLVLAGAVACLPAATSLANTYRPHKLGDHTPDGCTHSDCTLREAVLEANGHPGGDRIVLRGGKTYRLSIHPTGLDNDGLDGDLDVLDGSLRFESNSRKLATVDAQGIDRVFDLVSGGGTFERIKIRGGDAPGNDDGGGVSSNTPSGPAMHLIKSRVSGNEGDFGGGIYSLGRLTIRRSVVNGNQGVDGGGVAVDTDGTGSITKSTISGNRASNSGAGLETYGPTNMSRSTVSRNVSAGNSGGVNVSSGTFRATNSTFAGNSAEEQGGGIEAVSTTILKSVTIVRNEANSDDAGAESGGGVSKDSSLVTVRNSIVALNRVGTGGSGPDCSGTFTTKGRNLLTRLGGCTGFSEPPDIVTHRPRLGKLKNNGGPTKTVGLRRHSPAINHSGAGSPSRDQRGHKRHNPDIGAFERG